MNTIRSTWIGWGALCVAGGGAYYFAKRSINADKRARHEADMKRRRLTQSLEHNTVLPSSSPSHKPSTQKKIQEGKEDTGGEGKAVGGHVVGSPAGETAGEVAATGQQEEGSRFVAKEVYRQRRGDRFS